jgi:hypothetical protein
MLKTTPITIREKSVDFIPYKRLGQAIILQAIKDYMKEESWLSVRRWVRERQGTFDLCASAWNRNPEELQKIMMKKMNAIDKGEPLKLADANVEKLLVLADMGKKKRK